MESDATALPKYMQLAEFLIREITAGRYAVGDRLPPERQLAASLGVAVGTLRKALHRLQEQGVVQAVQGSGNYIRGGAKGDAIYVLFPLERHDGGGLPQATVVSLDRAPKPGWLPAFGTGNDAWRIRRVRSLDGAAVAAEEIWLDATLAPGLRIADLSESLYLYYREALNLRVSDFEDRIGVGEMPDWGRATGLDQGAPCGYFQRISQTPDGVRPEVSQTWFNHTRARYVARNR